MGELPLALLLSVLCAGVLIGVLSGLLGIGGGTLIIPLLRLGFGVDALVATATSLFTIIPTSLAGVVSHLRNRTVNIRAGLVIGLAGCVFSPLGSWLSVLAGGVVVMVAAAIVIIYTAINMIHKGLHADKGKAQPKTGEGGGGVAVGGNSAGDGMADSDAGAEGYAGVQNLASASFSLGKKNVLKLLAIGSVAGLLSGFIGVGGGFIIVPMLTFMLGFSMKEAAGTSLMAIAMLAVPGVVTHAFMGHVSYVYGIVLACGTIPGAYLGGILVKRIPDGVLRLMFGAILIVAGALLVVNELGLIA